jgi:hypothetical protein
MAGADVKDAQGQMRHAQASTTLNIYQQFVPDSQRQVVNKLGSLSRAVHRSSVGNCSQLQPKSEMRDVQVIENVVARDGVEPPTPAFSGSKLIVISST